MTDLSVAFIPIVTYAYGPPKLFTIKAGGMLIADVLLNARHLLLLAINTITMVSRIADTFIPGHLIVPLACGIGAAIVFNVTGHVILTSVAIRV